MTHTDEGGKETEAGKKTRPVSTGAERNQQAPEEGGAGKRTWAGHGAPFSGTQLNLSLWTAGLEVRQDTMEKIGLTSVGSSAAYFQTRLVSLVGFCFVFK